ncbi:unnamed protein product [Sphenostylis stenocarpa]|uniref:Non-specific lipid-transfer protein n=1 Tax=Sphenostylis stenocarpa TaxID=92480 RepID=A0AA86SUY3_9FABA|nr:unnamed protein product [Sphenostylis stenocarpa]
MEPPKGFCCQKAKKSLMPCLDFVTDKTDSPSLACCKGLGEVKASAPTKVDLRAACKCVQEGATHVPNMDYDKAQQLPKLCKVDIGFPITKDFDCSKIA